MQMSRLVCLGLSHQTAGVELRESVSGLLEGNARHPAIEEMVAVSTCNRVELYAWLATELEPERGRQLLLTLLAEAHDVAPIALDDHVYFHVGSAVAAHLYRVAAGLESLVLGEPQILGQIHNAFSAAQAAGQSGAVLAELFRIAVETGKRVRSETGISTNPASISSVAIALAHSVAGSLAQRRVLVVGLGEMGRLTVKTLRGRNVSHIDLANRTVSKAVSASAQWGGRAYGLHELEQAVAAADVVFTAATSNAPLLDAALVARAQAQRAERPLVLVDLAVPRNIDSSAGALPGVRLFDVDDLRSTLDEALAARQREVPRVEAMIDAAVARWQRRFRELTVKPVIIDLREKAEAIRQRELARTLRHLGDVEPQVLAHVQHLSKALVNQLLHEPTLRLKQKAVADDVGDYAETFRDLFGLETEEQRAQPKAGKHTEKELSC